MSQTTASVAGSAPDLTGELEAPDRIVRLNVNLSAEVADALRRTSRRSGLTLTEGVRRAVSIWKLLDDASRRGERIEVVDPETGRARELVLGV